MLPNATTTTTAASDQALTSSQEEFRYEGAEKTLEVHFAPIHGLGLRSLPQTVWDEILDYAKCKILSRMSNSVLDAYVLSESSLFVYADRIFLKTCGMTTLLQCLAPLLDVVRRELGSEMEWLRFSHKNFIYPQDQKFPHACFEQETHYCLDKLFPNSHQSSSAHVLGDLLSDHWNVLYLDPKQRATRRIPAAVQKENIVNFMMYGIDEQVAAHFYPKHALETQREAKHRIFFAARFNLLFDEGAMERELLDTMVDSFQFQPCGFSLNAIVNQAYYVTIHVTPEHQFSYASFETNLPQSNYSALLDRVLRVFAPKTCTVGLFSDSKHQSSLDCGEQMPYTRMSQESARIQNLFFAEMSSFERKE